MPEAKKASESSGNHRFSPNLFVFYPCPLSLPPSLSSDPQPTRSGINPFGSRPVREPVPQARFWRRRTRRVPPAPTGENRAMSRTGSEGRFGRNALPRNSVAWRTPLPPVVRGYGASRSRALRPGTRPGVLERRSRARHLILLPFCRAMGRSRPDQCRRGCGGKTFEQRRRDKPFFFLLERSPA